MYWLVCRLSLTCAVETGTYCIYFIMWDHSVKAYFHLMIFSSSFSLRVKLTCLSHEADFMSKTILNVFQVLLEVYAFARQ